MSDYWFGNIPSNWSTRSIGSIYSYRNIKVSDNDYPPLSVTMKGIIPQLSTAAKSDDHDNRKLVKKGDFVINSRSDRRGSCGIAYQDGSVSLINSVLSPKSNMNYDFYNYLFHSAEFASEFYKWGHGIVDDLWTTGWDEMKKIDIPIPPVDVQNKISKILDDKTFKIDALIANEQKQIEKLKAYKQALISEVVTKGLDPNVPMKDSGVDWIGKIPQNWKITKLKIAYQNINEKYSDARLPYIGLENIESFSGQYIKTLKSQFYDLKDSIKALKGCVIFGKLRPYLAKSYIVEEDCLVSSEFAVFNSLKGNSADYLELLFLSQQFIQVINSSTYGAKMPRADIDFINNLYIPLPSQNTQKNISTFLKKKLSIINKTIGKKENIILLFKEIKKSLIYEYVTGKKEVE